MIILLFVGIVLLQTVLIYNHHFSPFERVSNLRAVLWGARPAPRYWAVVALDACAGLLIALLVLGVLPARAPAPAIERVWFALLLAWIAVSLLAAVLYDHVDHTVIRFPNWGLIARRGAVELGLGALVVAGTLYAVALAITGDAVAALELCAATFGRAPLLLVAAYLLALGVFALRAVAFLLRPLPLVGTPAHAAVSTLALVALVRVYGALFSPAGSAGLDNLATPVFGIGALAIVALIAAWRLPGARAHADAVPTPSIILPLPASTAIRRTLDAAGGTLASAGVSVEVTRAPLSVVVRNAAGEVLWQLAPGGLRRELLANKVTAIPLLYTGNTIKFKWPLWSRPYRNADALQWDGDALCATLGDHTLRVSLGPDDICRLTFAGPRSLGHNALSIAFPALADAHYMGLGQRFDKVDRRGEELYFLVEEGGVGYEWACRRWPALAPVLKRLFGERGSFPNGPYCTGFPVPFGLVAREHGAATGLFWNTYQPAWLEIATGSGTNRLTVLGNELDLFICPGPKPLDAVGQYTTLTGRSPVPPPWVLLPWKTRTGAVTEADALEDIHKFRELDIPLAHVGIEHWQEVRGSYEFSPQWYPHIDDVVREAHANGMRITVWHFPYMNAGAATHREGVRRGYFIRNRLGLPYQQRIFHGIATVIDYTNPHAAAWHEAIVAGAFYRRGFQGAMTDYAESIPPDSVMYNGRSGLALRNAYPVLYCQSMQRAAHGTLGDNHLLYPRAGYAASQRFCAVQWPGDQDTDWDDGDGLIAAVRAMLNVSICGFPIHGSDIGGWYDWFAPITTKELYIRWAEVGAYSPLMRAHGGPIGRNREPWKFDDETVSIYRTLSREHVQLFPYLYSLAHAYTVTGAPLIRHPALLWPECAELYAVEDAWMIGDALYVAPVVRPGRTERTVILPPGEWWSLTESRPVRGPATVTVAAPLGVTPRFLRRGHILPRFSQAFDTFEEAAGARTGHLDDPLDAWIYSDPAAPARFRLFDGTELREGAARAGPRAVHWTFWGSPNTRNS